IPTWVTHVLELDSLHIRWQGRREEYRCLDEEDRSPESNIASSPLPTGQPVIELQNVSVVYGDRAILRDVTWTVRSGERWAVLGPNVSGKPRLPSFVWGDPPQAYSNDTRLLGQERGPGESFWEIKRRAGLVSPDPPLFFPDPLPAIGAAATGFFDVLTR